MHAGRGSEKSEKHFTFKSANRTAIVRAVSNEAPFGMPVFDFVPAWILLYGEIVFRFRVLVVGRHRAVADAPRVGHRLYTCNAAWAYSKGMSHCYHEHVYPRWTEHLVEPCSLFVCFFLYFYYIFSFFLLVTRVRPHFRCHLNLIIK